MDESHMSYAMGKKLDSKGYIQYNLIYMTFGKMQNHSYREQITGC